MWTRLLELSMKPVILIGGMDKVDELGNVLSEFYK